MCELYMFSQIRSHSYVVFEKILSDPLATHPLNGPSFITKDKDNDSWNRGICVVIILVNGRICTVLIYTLMISTIQTMKIKYISNYI